MVSPLSLPYLIKGLVLFYFLDSPPCVSTKVLVFVVVGV